MSDHLVVGQGVRISVESPAYDGHRIHQKNAETSRHITSTEITEGVYEIGAKVEATRRIGSSGLLLRFEICPWDTEGYVTLPGAVYAGNRFESRGLGYPPLLIDPEDIGPDIPPIIGNLPRLSKAGESSLQQLSGDLAWPSVGALNVVTGRAWIINFSERVSGVNTGITVEESELRDSLIITISAPGVRYLLPNDSWASGDRGIQLEAGDSIDLKVTLHCFECTNTSQLFESLIRTQTHPARKELIQPTVPFSEASRLIRDHYQKDNWNPSASWYSSSVVESVQSPTQLGWVGGLQTAIPLLVDGDESVQQRTLQSTKQMLAKGISSSGLVHGFISIDKATEDGFGKPHATKWHLVRKSCDVLFSIANLTDFMRSAGMAEADQHLWAIEKISGALTGVWRDNRQFGQFLDIDSREVIVGGSTSAALGPGALAKAARILQRPDLLVTACESAEQFHRVDVTRGYTCGGPGDALQAPDSESAFALLESFVTLYEETSDDHWLIAAVETAWLSLSWVVPYNYPFPLKSALGRIGAESAGTVLANIQNKHSAPGICTMDPSALLRLYRFTGEEAFLNGAINIARTIPQYISRDDRPIGEMPNGWICERVNLSDWESEWGRGPGETFDGSCWCEASMLLTSTAFPGVYVRLDQRRVWSADHVNVELNGETLTIENPTPFPADVRVLIDDLSTIRTPLTAATIALLPKVSIPAGCQTRISTNAQVQRGHMIHE